MKQTNATFLIDDGVLMADKDQVVSIANARIIIEPRDEPSAYEAEKRAEDTFRRMDRAARRLIALVLFFGTIYTLIQIVAAFVHPLPGVGK